MIILGGNTRKINASDLLTIMQPQTILYFLKPQCSLPTLSCLYQQENELSQALIQKKYFKLCILLSKIFWDDQENNGNLGIFF